MCITRKQAVKLFVKEALTVSHGYAPIKKDEMWNLVAPLKRLHYEKKLHCHAYNHGNTTYSSQLESTAIYKRDFLPPSVPLDTTSLVSANVK